MRSRSPSSGTDKPPHVAQRLLSGYVMDVAKVTCVLLGLSACIVGEDAEDDVVSLEKKKEGAEYERVVLGRMYHTERWMLPAADTYAPHLATVAERRIAYVCDALVKLKPTYVSGLVRLAWDTPISDDMRTIFNGVRQCVRSKVNHPVKFDVVLNALHFTERRQDANKPEDGVTSKEEGSERIKTRLKEASAAFAPDIWFFDFYTVPFNSDAQPYFEGAMRDGIDWIHNVDRKKVGGNAWGKNIPDGTDLIAVPLIGGFADSADQIAALTKQVPTLVHIRNDPHICDSEGLAWFSGGPDRRASSLQNHASKQAGLNVGYMYPLFFPLSATAECAPPNTPQVAYDAVLDGNLGKMRDLMDRYAYRPRVVR